MPNALVSGIIPWNVSNKYLLLKVKIELISLSYEVIEIRKGSCFVIV
jgi:hypothetical protein